jgi:hypothetical protein
MSQDMHAAMSDFLQVSAFCAAISLLAIPPQALQRESDRHVRRRAGGSAEPLWLSQWHPHYPSGLSGYRISVHKDPAAEEAPATS